MNFTHPITGEKLSKHQLIQFPSEDASYDFVVDPESQRERTFYDNTYAAGGWWGATIGGVLDGADFGELWAMEPASKDYLESLGDLKGKRVLLLGNGTSVKEFLFVQMGAKVVFTDLSFKGTLYAKDRYRESKLGREFPDACDFHAVNAYYLPFEDATFDLVCADAVIHHLDDLTKLFAGIQRVLKPGGICRFADTAYSSAWQGAKGGVLKSLQGYVHRTRGISPEDVRATERGGYRLSELSDLAVEVGFKKVYYKRVALFDYLLWRTHCKLNLPSLLAFRKLIRWMDRVIAKTPLMESQGISLIFGFDN